MTLDTSVYPYLDTFQEGKGYYIVLGKPKVSLQSREWNEMQSMLQNQIKRFGQNIFKEGSMVIPGASALNINYPFLKLQNQFNAINVVTANFVGKQIIGSSSGALATVLQGVDLTGSDSPTLYLQFNAGSSSQTFTGQITLNSTTVSGLSSAALKAIVVGSVVTGTGISASTYVTKIVNSSTVQINNGATATNSTASLNFSTATAFEDGENISTIETSPFSATLVSSSSSGVGSSATINQGIYFVNGFFVFVDTQTILLDKYDNTPSYNIGLTIEDSFITSASDPSLVDPANQSLNANAPGADRYNIELTLSKYALNATPSGNFIQLIQVKNGVIQNIVTDPVYSQIEKAIAREFYDANGNYYIKKFPLSIREDLNTGSNNGVYSATNGGLESDLVYVVGKGKANVSGYEIKTLVPTYLTAPKARTTTTKNEVEYNFDLGNYTQVNTMVGTFSTTAYETVNLNDTLVSGGAGSTIGTARIREMIWDTGTIGTTGAVYNLYLFDVSMNVSKTFSMVKSIRDGSGNTCDTILDSNSDATLLETNLNTAILPINEAAIATLKPSGSSATLYSVRRYFTGTLTGTPATSVTLTANTGEVFASGAAGEANVNYHVSLTSVSAGTVINMTTSGNSITLQGSPTGNQVKITIGQTANAYAGATVRVIATVNKSNVVQKTKTLATQVDTIAHANTIQLTKADIFELVSIIDSTTSIDITNQYTLDNGQRDNYYLPGKIIHNTAYASPSGNVAITYEYFNHGVGDFFSVDSYSIPYGTIPSYLSPVTGIVYPLVNCLDFRPRYDSTLDSNANPTTFSVTSEFPVSTEDVTFNYSSYLGRIDLVFLDKTGKFSVIQGAPAISPSAPNPPKNGMVLYQITVPPYTFNTQNVSSVALENRGYTMVDIGKLEARISNLENAVAMSLLEQSASSFFIPDATGNDSFKNGFLVDNFSSHLVGAVNLSDYQCSMDTIHGVLRPPFQLTNVGLGFDAADSANYQVTGELITLPYTTQSFISQLLATDTININPYAIYNWVGNLTLTPSSDDWYDTTTIPPQIIVTAPGSANAIAALNAAGYNGQTLWDTWVSSWVGSPITEPSINLSEATVYGFLNTIPLDAQASESSTLVWRSGSRAETLFSYNLPITPPGSQTVGSQVVSVASVPFMRANTISFSATGMEPNTQVYAFFNDVPISAYCTPTGGTLGANLITDINGKISGTFALPDSTTSLQFPTGDAVFLLIDNQNGSLSLANTSAHATYAATGTLETDQSTILSTQASGNVQVTADGLNSLVGTNLQQQVIQPIQWYDPLAQSFLVSTGAGAFLTKIDVYFASVDQGNVPVTLQIRDISTGYPGPNIVPFSTVTLNPSQITTSTDGSVATSFVFPSPVYLNDATSYCFVLISNSNEYTVYEATLGDADLVSGTRIARAPYTGTMFESQNGQTWIANPYSVLKFNIWNAQFSTTETASIIFENDVVDTIQLTQDPFTTTSSSHVVTAYHPTHGLATGQETTWSGIVGTQNGIAASQFNAQHTITYVDFDHYTVTLGGSTASSSGVCGGSSVIASTNVRMDTANINVQNLSFPQCSLNFGIKTLDDTGTQSTSYAPIPLTSDIDFFTSQLVESADNETTKSIVLQAQMSTTNANVSPVLDTNRASAIVASNRINYIVDSNGTAAGELLTTGGDSLARYITGSVSLTNPSNNIDVIFNALRPVGADIQVFVKMINGANTSVSLSTADWVLLNQVSYPAADNVTYNEYQFNLTGQANFTTFAIKIVMLSTDTAEVPQISAFRTIAT